MKRPLQLPWPVTLAWLVVLCAPQMAQAEIFKCTDASGKPVFSDQPCQGGKRETVDLRFRGTATPAPALEPRAATTAPIPAMTPTLPPPLPPLSPPAVQAPVTLPAPKPPEPPLADRLAAKCVDAYRGHLAYPQGVRVVGRTLEKSLSEWLITVQVKTISNPATPIAIDPIVIDEKFICVTDGGAGLNARSTDMYVQRHKRGDRL